MAAQANVPANSTSERTKMLKNLLINVSVPGGGGVQRPTAGQLWPRTR